MSAVVGKEVVVRHPVATPARIAKACEHLVHADPAFRAIIRAAGHLRFRTPALDHFAYLVRAIVFQQLAGKAASAIHGRLVAQFGTVTPERALATPEAAYRAAGISTGKYLAITDLARHAVEGRLTAERAVLASMSDDEIVEMLTQVRGIGPWTAQMFLLGQLHRLDVWPTGDLGVRKGFAVLHGTETPSPRELERAGDVLRPYRSVAALYCWQAVEPVPEWTDLPRSTSPATSRGARRDR